MYEVVRLEPHEPSYTEGIFLFEDEAKKAAEWLTEKRKRSVKAMNDDIDPDDPDYAMLYYRDDTTFEVFPIDVYTDFETWCKKEYKYDYGSNS